MSADTPEATRAGLEILARGGNAVDAAVAVSLVLGVTEPSESGLGGSLVMLLLPSGGKGTLIDAPWNVDDRASLAPPGALRVLHHAWLGHGSGRLTWEDVVEPAIRAAKDGYAIGTFSHHTMVLAYDQIIDDPAATRRLLVSDRSIPPEGTRITNRELAEVLEQIAADGPDAFYAGAIGRRLAHELASRPGGTSLTPASLAVTPAAREVPALRGSYRGRVVWSAPVPYAGSSVQAALDFLELVPSAWLERDPWTRTAWTVEALAFGFSGQGLHPVQRLAELSPLPTPPAERIEVADSGPPLGPTAATAPAQAAVGPENPAADAGEPMRDDSGSGTHFSVVDGEGNAVSASQTLGRSYGSGLVEPLGFFYQAAGVSNRLVWQVPTIVTRDGRVELVLGSPGGVRGVSAVVQVLAHVIDLEEPLRDAVHAPRLQLAPAGDHDRGRLFLEGVVWHDTAWVRHAADTTWGPSADTRVRARGFTTGERPSGPWPAGMDPWFGGVNAIARGGDAWTAVGDPRHNAFGGVLTRGAPFLDPADGSVVELPEPPDG